jgi:Fe-S-cluster-containing hydrogenase component 2
MRPSGADAPLGEDLKVLVLLCSRLERLGSGLDLDAVRGWLEQAALAVEVRVVPELCDRPAAAAEAVTATAAARVVMALCSQSFPELELHAALRRVGLDPFGVTVVNLGTYCAEVHRRSEATEKAKLLLRAGVARARAFTGIGSESVKAVLSWDQAVSRRALFTLPPLRYEPVPLIRQEACAFDEGCRVCAATCPRQALGSAEEGMILDRARCTGCGACISACPQVAIDLPGRGPQQVEAQLGALLNGPSVDLGPRGILFVCDRSAAALEGLAEQEISYAAGWLPVEVPCLGMVTTTWLLSCVNAGAAVAVLPCRREDCRFGKPEVTEGNVVYCRALLAVLGASPELVRLLDPRDPAQLADALRSVPDGQRAAAERTDEGSLFGARAAATALLRLAERFSAPGCRPLGHPFSPVGIVTVEPGCTMCEACTHACPTGALLMHKGEAETELAFDASRCIGCASCTPVCPEKVIRVEKMTDLSRLAAGKLPLYRDRETRCEACGASVAPRAMLERIAGMLTADDGSTLSVISRYCVWCRGPLIAGRAPVTGDTPGRRAQ